MEKWNQDGGCTSDRVLACSMSARFWYCMPHQKIVGWHLFEGDGTSCFSCWVNDTRLRIVYRCTAGMWHCVMSTIYWDASIIDFTRIISVSFQGHVVMGNNAVSPYQQVIEKTKSLSFRSQMLAMNIEKKLNQNSRSEVRSKHFTFSLGFSSNVTTITSTLRTYQY